VSRYVLYTDGASRGNPGDASIGAVLYQETDKGLEEVEVVSEAIGRATNNVAEYEAVIAGLAAAVDNGVDDIVLRSDSLLLVRQLLGEYRVKAAGLKPLYRKAIALLGDFATVTIEHVPREQNEVADALANAALDR
jgi:ribonuclease HI